MPRLTLLFVALLTSIAAEAQVYRCETAEGTIYSQMPCAENAERLPQYDPVDDDGGEPATGTEDGEESEPADNTPSALQNFISTLERQRNDEIGSIDANMKTLRDRLDATGDGAPDERTREMLETELASLASQRDSIANQYTSLIREATNRAGSANRNN